MFELLKILGMYFSIMLVFLVILLQFDYKNWNGIKKKDDATLYTKILNRLYFLTTTFSTAGYGDITPKKNNLRIVVMVIQLCVLIGIVELALEGIKKN